MKTRPHLTVLPGDGETPAMDPVDLCESTVGGFLWYCDEHDTHGNADSEDEAVYMMDSHVVYHNEIAQEVTGDPDMDAGCDPSLWDITNRLAVPF